MKYFPRHVQIQTTAYCNGACSYCPYPYISGDLDLGYMDDNLVKRLIEQTVDGGAERIIMYLMNEPLTDHRLFRFCRYIRDLSDDILIEISTNAKALGPGNRKWLRRLSNSLVIINVNRSTNLENVESFIKPHHRGHIVGIMYEDYTEKKDEIRHIFRKYGVKLLKGRVDDRAGNVPLDDGHPRRSSGRCYELRDTEFMHVLWNGDCVLCCQDWRREVVLGNAVEDTLLDIFNSEEYAQVRRYKVEGYPDGFLCTRCARLIE